MMSTFIFFSFFSGYMSYAVFESISYLYTLVETLTGMNMFAIKKYNAKTKRYFPILFIILSGNIIIFTRGRKDFLLNKTVEHFYNEIKNDDFISSHEFTMHRFDDSGFFAYASTLSLNTGRLITVAFIVHDKTPELSELTIQLHNMTTAEQIKVVGNKIAMNMKANFNVFLDSANKCITMVSYFDINDVTGILNMMRTLLYEFKNVTVLTYDSL